MSFGIRTRDVGGHKVVVDDQAFMKIANDNMDFPYCNVDSSSP
jgi:hypothetical protein